ncbi:MAG TPA: cation diffusion facilitator family transporter, partial [Kiritimatiellia bacterium]|nr:cation diffusion facilitator family transporter [Kiritimatiellia bacterium]
MTPERRITHLSIWINLGLTALKLAAGLLGRSQALVADAVHSLSDFATDFAVLVGLRLSSKPRDDDHAYGHGKYETIVAAIIGLALAGVALEIASLSLHRIFDALRGEPVDRLPWVPRLDL